MGKSAGCCRRVGNYPIVRIVWHLTSSVFDVRLMIQGKSSDLVVSRGSNGAFGTKVDTSMVLQRTLSVRTQQGMAGVRDVYIPTISGC